LWVQFVKIMIRFFSSYAENVSFFLS
jgi:hypothetical protein